jgi:hypothetical protein
MRLVGRVAALCSILVALFGVVAHAETVSVTIGVGDTILSVSGQTSPDAFVTISKDGSVIGTTAADNSGAFGQTFPAQEPGIHQLSIFAHTAGGQNTDTVSLNVNIAEHATTTVDVFLPPTILVTDNSLDFGQQLELSGEAAPSSTIIIYVNNSDYATATADAQGLWNTSLNTGALPSGQHSLFVRAVDGVGEQSYPSASRSFSVAAQRGIPPPASTAPKAPIITFPKADTVWREQTITVTGSAGGTVQIELWDGGTLIGSVWSNSQGKWSMPLQLEPKSYELRARACLDQKCSAFSPTVRFTYEPTTPIPPNEQPLKIAVPRSSFTVYERQTVPLRATVIDGQPPYRATIDWGDGKIETRTYTQDDLLFPHAYDEPGKYTVKIHIQDSQGRENTIFFTIDVQPTERPGFSFTFPVIALFLALTFLLSWLLIFTYRRWFVAAPRK